ncbi:MAG TPA: aspartate/glutamate racemase family protein [Bacteroidales bacterium]|jgi:aspartate racemase|nr:aspartate/glutamate racemase family protein [Bacteroidales bacterium]
MRPKSILGVLGGMGPAATADFMLLLSKRAPASCDQEHPETIVYSNTITPDRTSFLLGTGPSPGAEIKRGIEALYKWGADVLAVPCNTAHYFLDELISEGLMPLPLIHIIQETIKAAARISPDGAWLTATMGTIKTGLYQKHAEVLGYTFRIPSQEQNDCIQRTIDLVKSGEYEKSGKLYKGIIEELWSSEKIPIVCACTELPIAYDYTGLDKNHAISSLHALADACIEHLYNPETNK